MAVLFFAIFPAKTFYTFVHLPIFYSAYLDKTSKKHYNNINLGRKAYFFCCHAEKSIFRLKK